MPVDMSRYPANWIEISNYIRFERAQGQCECTGECGLHEGRCDAAHGEPHPVTGSKVSSGENYLGTDTGDKHDKMDVRPENLKAMCQRCHLSFDMSDHVVHAKETRTNNYVNALHEAGQMEMDL